MVRDYRAAFKEWLGEWPLAAELDWYLRQRGKPVDSRFSLDKLGEHLPVWKETAMSLLSKRKKPAVSPRQVLIFSTLHYWIEHTTLLGMALAGLGHEVTYAFAPYANWQAPLSRFDVRKQNVYAKSILSRAAPLFKIVSFVNNHTRVNLPRALAKELLETSRRDTQYTLQMEEVDLKGELYRLRVDRNQEAATNAFQLIQTHRPDVVIIPNGTILEFGAVRLAAQYLGVQVVTYEFGEQRQRIWLAQDREVMRQETDDLWLERKDTPLTAEQWEQVKNLFQARQRASLWENFSRRWQGAPSEGGEKARAALGLDRRPIVLLATNVFGDSLTLGRQVFSESMGEWMERTLRYFAGRQDVQLVMRIHPGELLAQGPSAAVLVNRVLPELPEHIHIVLPGEKINTYDIVQIADLGLVYTTTVGMEMAMSGVPVIVVGNTHYRSKGFTLDPDTWEAYFETLDKVLENPPGFRLSEDQVHCAWNYAYRFFFEYPHPFPWHLLKMWEDLKEWPLDRVLGPEGQESFAKTFRYLAGERVSWE